MTAKPSRRAICAKASPTRRFKSSDSTTQGPAIRNGASVAPKCAAMRLGLESRQDRGADVRRRPVGLVPGRRRADEAREERVRTGGPRLELGMELAAHKPGMLGELDHLDQGAVR